jgi:hypothetical protein
MTQMEIPVTDLTSVADYINFLLHNGIFKERDVIMMQYLMRSIDRPDLELKCVEYARRKRQALCYFEEMTSKGKKCYFFMLSKRMNETVVNLRIKINIYVGSCFTV